MVGRIKSRHFVPFFVVVLFERLAGGGRSSLAIRLRAQKMLKPDHPILPGVMFADRSRGRGARGRPRGGSKSATPLFWKLPHILCGLSDSGFSLCTAFVKACVDRGMAGWR